MSLPQSIAQSDNDADLSAQELERGIEAIIGRANAVAAPPPIPRPVAPKAGGRGSSWGLHDQRITSPLEMLAEVADHAYALHQQALALVAAVTGEAPPPLRLRQRPVPGGGFLPAVANIAHEIETQHAEIARLFEHLRGKL